MMVDLPKPYDARDEEQLMDYFAGHLVPAERVEVERRLEYDYRFRRKEDAVRNLFSVMDRYGEPAVPANLAEKTIERARLSNYAVNTFGMRRDGGGAYRPTFSRWEIAAVAAVLLFMAGILIPSFIASGRRAAVNQCGTRVGRIGAALKTYALDHDEMLPSVKTQRKRWLGGTGEHTESNSQALFKLLSDGYVQSPVVFQCPSVAGSSFAVEKGMSDFPAPELVSFSYQHSIGREIALGSNYARQMAILGDQTPVFDSNGFRREEAHSPISHNHGGAGQNVLYLDGHVEWASESDAGVHGDNIYLVRNVREYDGSEAPVDTTDTFLLPSWTGTR